MNRKGYEINYITNTITVSKKFLEQASTLGGNTYETMKALRELGMPIIPEKTKKRKASSRLTYKQMLHHISCLADARHYLAEFEAVRKASKGEEHPYKYVENWYESTFPNHAAVPEFDENFRIVNTPADYAANI